MMDYIASHGLDIFTTVLGLVYILLEYRASIWLWLVGIIMPALDVWLYWSHGLYGDAGMAVYYTIAGIYGYAVWKYGKKHNQKEKEELPITYMKKSLYLPTLLFFLAAWGITYYILITFTNSTVPLQDSFTNALSVVGLWALARKYIEQWFFWIIVDAVCFYLYIVKGIPFKAGLYGLYVIIAVAGYFKWKKMIKRVDSLQLTVYRRKKEAKAKTNLPGFLYFIYINKNHYTKVPRLNLSYQRKAHPLCPFHL